jgi:N-acetylmuramoyl-L-alanine amidase
MAQRFAGILKRILEAWAAKFTAYVDIEVLLTKTDENVNMRGRDRAKVAKDAKADFFVILHFNSVPDGSAFSSNNLEKRYDYEQAGFLDITPGVVGQVRDLPEGYRRRLFSVPSSLRGPLRVKRSNNNAPDHTLVTSAAFSKTIVTNVVAVMKELDSTPSIKAHGDVTVGVAALSKDYLGTKEIACCYLEGDFINVESGDRTWNPVQYAAKIPSVNGGVAVDASAMPAENAMFEAGSVAIALAILVPILRTAVVPRSGKDLKTLVGELDPQGGIQPALLAEQ